MPGTKRTRSGAKVTKPSSKSATTEFPTTLTIASVPDHLLISIFKTFDNDSIESASRVCKHWRNLIASSTLLMRRLEITLNIKSKTKTRDSLTRFNRLPFRRVIIRPKFLQNQRHLAQLKANLKRHEAHIEQIDFFLASASTVCSVLSHMRADVITHLKLTQSFREFVPDSRKISLPNLTYLETHQAGSFLKMLKVHRLETLKIIHAYDDREGLDRKIDTFLRTCVHLRALLFEKHFPVLTEVENLPFRLNSFSLSNAENEKVALNLRQQECLVKLLTVHLDTLETLLIGNFTHIEEILEVVYERARKLRSLFLICPTINSLDQDSFKVNNTITDLCVVLHADCDTGLTKTRTILAHSRAVETLRLSCVSGDMSSLIVEASHSMRKLKKLHINTMRGDLRGMVTCESLETVSIERLFEQRDVNALMRLAQCAPKMRELSVRYWGCDKTPFLSKERLARLLMTTRLEKLHLGGFFRLPNSFIETLIETKDSTVLRELEIESCVPESFNEGFKRITEMTKVKCTALQWKAEKRGLGGDDEDEDDSDLEDYDFEGHETDSEEWNEVIDERDFPADDDDVEEVPVVEHVQPNADDRYDANGLRRSKRLRRC